MNEEIVEVSRAKEMTYQVGDKVNVVMQKSLGTRAVMLGYFVPFLLVLFTLIISLNLMENQGLSGLLALGILIPYYLVLYMNKDRLKKAFIFSIQ